LPDISHLRERRKLARDLRAARAAAGLTGSRLAAELGWAQSRVSRIETGTIFPTPDDIRAWAAAVNAVPKPLLEQRQRAEAEYASWARQGSGARKQASIGALEEASKRIAKFQPVLIPSQVRTAEFAAELLRLPLGPLTWGEDQEGVDRMVAAQLDRQRVLYRPGKRVQVVVLEAALRTRTVSPEAMAGQLDRLLAIGGLPSLEFGIIPTAAQVPVYPLSGFVIFDDHLVSVETLTGEQRISEPAEVKAYLEAFDLLNTAAVHGREATELVRAALAEFM
jgi:transcriptional regulator with XRE-family HTH domain